MSGCRGESCQAEVGQAAAFERGCPRHHLLRAAIDADVKTSIPRSRFFVGGGRPTGGHDAGVQVND